MEHTHNKYILDSLGWVHYRQVLPSHLISSIRDQISDQLALNKSRDCLFFKSDLDRAAVRFYRNNPDQLSLLQGMLPNLPAVYELALHPLIGNLLEESIGWSESVLSPIHNLRAKLPWNLSKSPFTTVPWHQDYGASDPTIDRVRLVTVWIPLGPASTYHGGLEIIPRSNHLGWLPHSRAARGPEVNVSAMCDALKVNRNLSTVSVQASAGDVIIFDQLTLHKSCRNKSRICRWSLDFRYAALGQSTGRPGQWDSDPRIGDDVESGVMKLVRQRYSSEIPIRKRVDEIL